MRKMNSSKRAIVISLTIHLIAFIVISWIKLGSEIYAQSKVPVTFMKAQNERVLRRSIPIRELNPSNTMDQKPSFDNAVTDNNTLGNSSGISVNVLSHRATEVRSITPFSLDGMESHKLKTEFDVRPVTISARDTQIRTAPSNASVLGGFKLVSTPPVELAKPQINVSPAERKNILQDYLNGIKQKIESKKKYPEAARNAGIEGRSGIQMTITKDGLLEDLRIYESSGNEILDNSALQSVRDALPFPPIPESLGRERIELKFYLVFKINV